MYSVQSSFQLGTASFIPTYDTKLTSFAIAESTGIIRIEYSKYNMSKIFGKINKYIYILKIKIIKLCVRIFKISFILKCPEIFIVIISSHKVKIEKNV